MKYLSFLAILFSFNSFAYELDVKKSCPSGNLNQCLIDGLNQMYSFDNKIKNLSSSGNMLRFRDIDEAKIKRLLQLGADYFETKEVANAYYLNEKSYTLSMAIIQYCSERNGFNEHTALVNAIVNQTDYDLDLLIEMLADDSDFINIRETEAFTEVIKKGQLNDSQKEAILFLYNPNVSQRFNRIDENDIFNDILDNDEFSKHNLTLLELFLGVNPRYYADRNGQNLYTIADLIAQRNWTDKEAMELTLVYASSEYEDFLNAVLVYQEVE